MASESEGLGSVQCRSLCPGSSPCSGPRPAPGTGTQGHLQSLSPESQGPIGETVREALRHHPACTRSRRDCWWVGRHPRGVPRGGGPRAGLMGQLLHRVKLKWEGPPPPPKLPGKVWKNFREEANAVLKEMAIIQSENHPVNSLKEPLN